MTICSPASLYTFMDIVTRAQRYEQNFSKSGLEVKTVS